MFATTIPFQQRPGRLLRLKTLGLGLVFAIEVLWSSRFAHELTDFLVVRGVVDLLSSTRLGEGEDTVSVSRSLGLGLCRSAQLLNAFSCFSLFFRFASMLR